ncbi:succinate-semialdehyde dehydrogenase (NADP(+)) [Rhodospirillum rubrum]|uniref:NAD-dependent succinate-semialdehyde dehydrogenase n=1 Tax=Rhodospirillum rubrum TaxID=1085 RepID=UPI001904DDC5|nr:NAD-dependent succinate-semialdehyde dehydrogenase [Rhodospirillum rubrum]MBK1664798.1 succinate-semialdehyde dehydrogenase (NADP(+)) [Rhodospirillum rubrum]MBK1676702.1 succinate-semialdehyde dehydrogenase (NADP(+)) [Rhodospirillum rubrum]
MPEGTTRIAALDIVREAGLLKDKAYIDGAWVAADDGRDFPVLDPATGREIGRVPNMGAAETRRAIDAAAAAWPEWRARTAKDRAAVLRRWYGLIMDNQEALAVLMTAEQGKPLGEARGEIAYGASFVEWFAEEGKRLYGEVVPAHGTDKRILTLREPIGVVAAITPWNFPSAMITRKVAPALAAGCPVVLKPAEDTPLSALALMELAERAGLPKGLINVVTTNEAKAVGGEMTANPIVRKLSFTGSTEVGKILMAQCAGTVKKVSLELGGNAPFIVFDDADLDAAVAGAIASKYRNAGQTCVCANRLYVQDGIYEAFTEKLKAKVEAMRVGPALEGDVQQGPLINKKGLDKVDALVRDALDKGASAVLGGKVHALGGTFYEPTILTGVSADMRMATEEIFGPVAPLYRFSTEAEAIALANATRFGLAAYFYTRDIGRVWRVAEGLEYGIVGINEGIISTESAPFGGVKESGIGREGSRHGIDDFVEIKYLCMGGI